MTFHVLKTNFRGNPNVGLYLYATDSYCLAGPEVPEEDYERISHTLGVPVHRMTIAGTGLVGVFLAGNNKHLLVPSIITHRESMMLEKLGIEYTALQTDFTALGNNIIVNDHGALISEEYTEADQKTIAKALGVPTKPFKIGELTIVGSCASVTSRGALVHRYAEQFEQEMIAHTLRVPVTTGSVNLGNPYVKGGVIANKNGMIIGELSGGPEIVNAEEALNP